MRDDAPKLGNARKTNSPTSNRVGGGIECGLCRLAQRSSFLVQPFIHRCSIGNIEIWCKSAFSSDEVNLLLIAWFCIILIEHKTQSFFNNRAQRTPQLCSSFFCCDK